jgi:putative ABC transport system substrate-binding protein
VKLNEVVLGILLILVFLAVPVPSSGQGPGRVFRIGWLAVGRYDPPLSNTCPSKGSAFWETFVQELQARGYVQGRNLLIECRYTQGRSERAAALAAELVSLNVDLIVAGSIHQVWAAMNASSALPIVMHSVRDPIGRGIVSTLARPGGNVTGITHDAGPEMVRRHLALLMEAGPKSPPVCSPRAPLLPTTCKHARAAVAREPG